jgi:hypothetical protein
MAEQEAKEDDQDQVRKSEFRANIVAVGAAVMSAVAAIMAAMIRH